MGTFFAYGQTGSGKTFSISDIERLVAEALFDGTLPGERNIHAAFFELAGNSAFGRFHRRIYNYFFSNMKFRPLKLPGIIPNP